MLVFCLNLNIFPAILSARCPSGKELNRPVKISALIFNYNGARFLSEAVGSVLKQEFPPVDVVIADDGSTDDSRSKALAFGGRVQWLDLPHGGQGAALNAAVDKCRGEWIAFLESDDIWLGGKLKELAAFLDNEPGVVAVQHEMEQVDAELSPRPTWRTSELRRWGLDDFLNGRTLVTGMSALAVRRDVLEKLLPLPPDLLTCIDEFLQPRLLAAGAVAHLPRGLGLRRIHGSNFYADIRSDPRRLSSYLGLRSILDRHLDLFLKKQGAALSDFKARQMSLERLTLELLQARLAGRWQEAFGFWTRGVLNCGPRPYAAFKALTTGLMLISPASYSSLFKLYENQRWLYRLRSAWIKSA